MKNDFASQLAGSNTALVYAIAKDFIRKGLYAIEDDLVSAGLEGLVMAAERFDPSLGTFSTYAYRMISGYMYKEIARFSNHPTLSLDDEQAAPMNCAAPEKSACRIVDDLLAHSGLNARERDVVSSRYGIDCAEERAEDIGARYRLTPQMINHIRRQALEKMRHAA